MLEKKKKTLLSCLLVAGAFGLFWQAQQAVSSLDLSSRQLEKKFDDDLTIKLSDEILFLPDVGSSTSTMFEKLPRCDSSYSLGVDYCKQNPYKVQDH